ncbi:MAG: DUF6067 family protein [Candidatus Bathyarchaeia archaeon]
MVHGSGLTVAAVPFCLCLALSMSHGVAKAMLQKDLERGLVVHYDFSEGAGTTLRDKSGNKNDGKIFGAAWVRGQSATALDFDGVNDYVDCGDNEQLRVNGAITITVWLKTLSRARQYVISKYSWSIYLSRGDGVPHFETMAVDAHYYGWLTVGANKPLPLNEWAFVAGVYNPDAQKMSIYANGTMEGSKPRKGGFGALHRSKLMIGRWMCGDSGFYFDGLIGEVRIYNRALSNDEIQQLYRLGLQKIDRTLSSPLHRISLKPHLFFVQRKVAVDLHLRSREALSGEVTAELQLMRRGKEQPIQHREVTLLPDSRKAEVTFSLANLPSGDYEVRAHVKDKNGKQLAGESASFTLPEKPWWLGSKEGISEKVLPPWTPLAVKRGRSLVEISCWGRTYRFGNQPFPNDVETAGHLVLAEPIRILARANGRVQRWQGEAIKLKSQAPAKVSFSQRAASDDLALSAETVVEYDGMVRVDWRVKSRSQARLEELMVEIPFRAEHAKYLYYYPDWSAPWEAHRPGALPEKGMTMVFNPVLWLGDEECGLEWFCESDRNWFNADPKRAIEIIRDGKTVILRLNLVTSPVELSQNSLTYTFGFQATPVKPKEKDAWDYRITWLYTPVYGFEQTRVNGELLIDRVAKLGLRTLALMDWTDILCYNAPTEPENLRNFVKEAHKRGMQVLVYFGFQVSERAPEFEAFLDNCAWWRTNTPYSYGENPDSYPPKPQQQVYRVCYRSEWQDFVVAGIAKLMDEYDIDGVYLDGTGIPVKCYNPHHGCGYEKPDGSREGTFPIFAGRETVRRIYTVVKSRKPNGQVNLHNSGFMLIPVLAWATSYWDGEQLSAKPGTFPLERLPLDMFRTEFMGHQWGVPAEFLHYVLPCKYEDEWAFTLLHDVPVRPYGLGQIEFAAKIWHVFDIFGRKQAQWLPYWRNTGYVSVQPEGVYVSLYRHPKNGVLAVVSNLNREPFKVTVTLNAKNLHLRPDAKAYDALSNETIPFLQVGPSEFRVSLDLLSLGWRVIWIQ